MSFGRSVEHRWWLVDSRDMSQIAELNAKSKQLQPLLNSGGRGSCWINLFDAAAGDVVPHQTALRCDRNDRTIWSGEIIKTEKNSQDASGGGGGNDKLTITAVGWQDALNYRLLHTGAEFAAMLLAPNGVAWQAQHGSYVCPGVDLAISLAYSAIVAPSTTDATIIFDLLDRANIDHDTRIVRGSAHGSPVQRNLTLQRFQNVGQQITTLLNVEAGCDLLIDPVTRQMDLYGVGASGTPKIPNGYGFDRPTAIFSYPGNCLTVNESDDGTVTANRDEVTGQYGAGRADDIQSQNANNLREINDQLSQVVDQNILIAYANAQVAVRKDPWKVITFSPRGLNWSDATGSPGVPRPFVDYNVGDVVYCVVNRGAFQAGTRGNPQPTRLFGFTLDVDDNGVEKVSSIQTTYQALGGGGA